MPRAPMSQADVPRGGTVRADVGITHPLLTEPALPAWPRHTALRLPGVRAGIQGRPGSGHVVLSPLFKTQPRTGFLGPGLWEGWVACVPGEVTSMREGPPCACGQGNCVPESVCTNESRTLRGRVSAHLCDCMCVGVSEQASVRCACQGARVGGRIYC